MNQTDTYDIKQIMSQNAQKLEHLMPPTIAQIGALVGLDNAMRAVQYFGGLDINIPLTPKGAVYDDLVYVFGKSNAHKIWQFYQGERIYINRCESLKKLVKEQAFLNELLKLMETGVKKTQAIKQLAIAFDFSERHGYEILRQADNRQLSLDF